MDERSFQGLYPWLSSHIQFQEPAVDSEKVYIPTALVVLFYNVYFLVKVLTLFSDQIFTVLWKIVQV